MCVYACVYVCVCMCVVPTLYAIEPIYIYMYMPAICVYVYTSAELKGPS